MFYKLRHYEDEDIEVIIVRAKNSEEAKELAGCRNGSCVLLDCNGDSEIIAIEYPERKHY